MQSLDPSAQTPDFSSERQPAYLLQFGGEIAARIVDRHPIGLRRHGWRTCVVVCESSIVSDAIARRDQELGNMVAGPELAQYASRLADHFVFERDHGVLTVRMHTAGGPAQ